MKIAEWSRIRASLKKDFERQGITRCENCGGTFGLGFAHRFKRRMLVESEKRIVVLLCQICHEAIEYSGHANMYEKITAIIENRLT